MTAMMRIRQDVFGETQAGFAALAGVSQATVSRWDRGLLPPTRDHMTRIRVEASRRRLMWNDAWFFEGDRLFEIEPAQILSNTPNSASPGRDQAPA